MTSESRSSLREEDWRQGKCQLQSPEAEVCWSVQRTARKSGWLGAVWVRVGVDELREVRGWIKYDPTRFGLVIMWSEKTLEGSEQHWRGLRIHCRDEKVDARQLPLSCRMGSGDDCRLVQSGCLGVMRRVWITDIFWRYSWQHVLIQWMDVGKEKEEVNDDPKVLVRVTMLKCT